MVAVVLNLVVSTPRNSYLPNVRFFLVPLAFFLFSVGFSIDGRSVADNGDRCTVQLQLAVDRVNLNRTSDPRSRFYRRIQRNQRSDRCAI